MREIISEYTNGNYKVVILANGTKMRLANAGITQLKPEFPESIDIKITNNCNIGCSFCSENSNINGKHGIIKPELFEGLPKIELAIGGGDPLAHPQISEMLAFFSDKFICNMTVNGKSLKDGLYSLVVEGLIRHKLIYGLGVSYCDDLPEIPFENAVVHCIAGVHSIDEIRNAAEKNKVLILGLKNKGRVISNDLYERLKLNIDVLRNELYTILGKYNLSFDNLALEQLRIKEFVKPEKWDKHFMGEDGKFSMFYDMVEGNYHASSNNTKAYPAKTSIVNFFKGLQNE